MNNLKKELRNDVAPHVWNSMTTGGWKTQLKRTITDAINPHIVDRPWEQVLCRINN